MPVPRCCKLLLIMPAFLFPSLRLPVAMAQEVHSQIDYKLYEKWIDEDARWIITDHERADYDKLATDQQRDEFIEAFWERRNPTPGDSENGFKEEHYRRLAYANTHFAAGVPGYKTDRGHFYIVYGPPDSIESFPKLSPPSEVWHYRGVGGAGQDLVLRFVDTCRCGEYVRAEDHSERSRPRP